MEKSLDYFASVTHPPESWAPVRRAAAALKGPIQRMLEVEAASGIVLLIAATLALVWANIDHGSYHAVWHAPISGGIGPWDLEKPLHFAINDGLMTVFFFVVGLEIRRELHEGELASVRKAALPVLAAIGGMVVPALLFVVLNLGRAGLGGWAIPMATDIAFAIGVLTVLGSRIEGSSRVLLLGLAVIDDIGAVIIIAVLFSTGIALEGIALIAIGIALAFTFQFAGARSAAVYILPGAVVWLGFLVAGVHPTIAGVVLGLMTPVRPWFGLSGFAKSTQAHLETLAEDREEVLSALDHIERARREAVSPAERLIHRLHPWVAFGIMPVFALANAGVPIEGADLSGDAGMLFVGIVVGLVIGKPLGIAVCGLAARRLAGADAPSISRHGLLLVGIVGGVGFTMALFIAQLAFPPGPLLDTAKLAIVVGSGIAIVVGLALGLTKRKADS